jgi:hypothetical protein
MTAASSRHRPPGRNFAAVVQIAYVLDEDGTFEHRCNLSDQPEPVEPKTR